MVKSSVIPASKIDTSDRLRAAVDLLKARRALEARALLQTLVTAEPRLPETRRLLGAAFQQLGDAAAAEREFRIGLGLDQSNESLALALAELLARAERLDEAEGVLRASLSQNPRSVVLSTRMAELLVQTARPEDAVELTTPLVAGSSAEHAVLAAHASALKALLRLDEALAVQQRAVAANPWSVAAEHNVAATMGDMARFAECEASARRAFAKGGDAPATWLVYARALLGQNRLDEAEAAFRQALQRQPDYFAAHRDLAQLVWMRTEDVEQASSALNKAIRDYPKAHAFSDLKARLHKYAGDAAAGLAVLSAAIAQHPDNASLETAAAHFACLTGDMDAALAHAEAAIALAPAETGPLYMLFEACAASGQAGRAAGIAERLVERDAFDQNALAYQATAWRMLGDERYRQLYDYDAFVGSWRLDTPAGWNSLEDYLADLAGVLSDMHPFRTHPLDQSLRHGSQASNLTTSEHPVVKAFFQAVDGPIRRHLAALGTGDDPVRGRNIGGYTYRGAWSVRLRPQGFHTDHIHPQGWLSSACYIALPDSVRGSQAREGWIKFGEPGIATRPALEPERFVEPKSGLLVLFPSYMWHGTVPFAGSTPRLTIAFDLAPDA